MMRSLFSGVSGLKNHQIRMDVVGNNISNVNTVGYKRSRVAFQEMMLQTIRGAGAPQTGRGGTNPAQIGLGVNTGTIDAIFTQGSLQSTGRVTDLAIQGDGFFILADGTDNYYTRAGNFDLDRDGNLIDKGSGMKVMGWVADSAGNINTSIPIGSINVPIGRTYPPTSTTTINYGGNLNAAATVGTQHQTTMDVYDSQGNVHRIITTYAPTESPPGTKVPNSWSYTVSLDSSDTLIQNYLATYYPNFSTMSTTTQNQVLAQASQVFMGGYASASGVGRVSGAGVLVKAETAGSAGNNLSVTTSTSRGSSTAIASPTTVRVNGNAATVHLAKNTAGTVTATLDDVVTAINAGGNAYLTGTGMGANPSGITFEARTAGTGGNAYSITLVDPGAVGALSVTAVGNAITVNLAHNGAVVTSTLQQVIDAINNTAASNALVFASLDDPAVGAQVAAAQAVTNLANGTDPGSMLIGASLDAGATGSNLAEAEPSTLQLANGSASNQTGSVVFTASGLVDEAATRTANGATSPNLTNTFMFQPAGTNWVQTVPDIKDLTQYTAAFTAQARRQNGNPSGTLQSINVSKTGTVSGVFSNGFTMDLGMIGLAIFNNPAGLLRMGDNLSKVSSNSGSPMTGSAETGGRGTIVPGALEMSNVDLAQEFTDMIVTQRGFQANTRIITTSDEMLQELASLKR